MEKIIVFCCCCGNHFQAGSVKEAKPDVTHGKLYICNGCYEAIPQSSEPVQTLRIVKNEC